MFWREVVGGRGRWVVGRGIELKGLVGRSVVCGVC